MIELFICSSEWECVKEIIGGVIIFIIFIMYSVAFCRIAGPRKSIRIEPLDRFIFYLAYLQVTLYLVITLLYSSYIVGYFINMLALFQEMLICSIFLLVAGTISGLQQLKCILLLMLFYLLAIMGVAIYLSLITSHDQDVIECQGTIWIVLCGNNLFITVIVLIFALLSLRRRKISPEGRATIRKALGNESIFFESRDKSGTDKLKDVVNKNTFIEDEDEQIVICSPFSKAEDKGKQSDSDDAKDKNQNQFFEDSASIKLDQGTDYTRTRPTMDYGKSHAMHIDKEDMLFTKLEPQSQDKMPTSESPIGKFDLMSYEVARKKKDLVILLICAALTVTLSLVWELLVYLDVQNSSCYHFQHHRPIWLLGIFALLKSLSSQIILVAIYYVIYWKNRRNLRGFDFRSDIAIHDREGTVSSKYGKISLIERKNQTASKTFSGSHERLLKSREESSANFTLREVEEANKANDRSSSHQFEAYDLCPSQDSYRHSGSSASIAANVTNYVRTTLVKKKKSTVNRKRGKERTQSYVAESP